MEREENINKLIQLSCSKKRYHYMTVFLCLLMAINMNIFNVGVIYLKRVCDIKENCQFSIPMIYDYSNNKLVLGFFGAFPYIGNYIFGLVFSPLTDYIGHKLAIFIGGATYIVFLSMCVLIHNFWAIFVFLIFSQISSNLMLYSSLFLGQELASSQQRALIGSIINTGFCLSGLLHLLYFNYNLSFKVIFAIDICITSFLLIPFNYSIYDSPRFYLEHFQTEEGLTILEKISTFNKDKVQFQKTIKTREYQKIIKSLTKGTDEEEEMSQREEEVITYSIPNIFKFRSLYRPFLILNVLWFCTAFIYNGIAFILAWEEGFIIQNTVIIYFVEGLSYFVAGLLINISFLGRKKVTYGMFFITSAFVFIMLMLNNVSHFDIFVAISRFCFSGIYSILFTYTPECYPRGFKAGCFGINVLSAALGSTAMSLCVEFLFNDYKNLFYYTGGSMALICGVLALFLEETIDQPFMSEIKEIREMKEREKKKEEKIRAYREKMKKESQSDLFIS